MVKKAKPLQDLSIYEISKICEYICCCCYHKKSKNKIDEGPDVADDHIARQDYHIHFEAMNKFQSTPNVVSDVPLTQEDRQKLAQ